MMTQSGSAALANTKDYPFNDSRRLVAFETEFSDAGYFVRTEALEADGEAGEIVVSGKALNGFAIEYSGSAKHATLRWEAAEVAARVAAGEAAREGTPGDDSHLRHCEERYPQPVPTENLSNTPYSPSHCEERRAQPAATRQSMPEVSLNDEGVLTLSGSKNSLVINLAERQCGYDMNIAVSEDAEGMLTEGAGCRYVAEIRIPARRYELCYKGGADDLGIIQVYRRQEPFDPADVAVDLWPTQRNDEK